MRYFDANGREIVDGSLIRIGNEVERVYSCGNGDLGILASNSDYLRKHPDAGEEFYPLSEFDTGSMIVLY